MKGIDVWKLNSAMAWGSTLQTRQRLRNRDAVIRAHRITPRPFIRLPERLVMNINAQISAMKNPVDPDLFLKMTRVFHNAARNPLPQPKKRGPGLYLTDIPMNRGMLGVIKALRDAEVPEESFSAFSNRIMLMGSIFKHAEYFPGFIKPSINGATDVADALLKAAAIARIIGDDRAAFDLDDVLAKAREFEADATGSASHSDSKAK